MRKNEISRLENRKIGHKRLICEVLNFKCPFLRTLMHLMHKYYSLDVRNLMARSIESRELPQSASGELLR